MKFKAVSGIMLTLLLIGMLTLAFNIQPAKANSATYTRIYLPNEWISDGVAMDWHGDDDSWSYVLPFEFPFYGNNYGTIYISSNGLITFISPDSSWGNSISDLAGKLAIAPAWDDWRTDQRVGDDIYIWQPDLDHVIIRWQVVAYYDTSIFANFEAILGSDGVIKFNYGQNNGAISATVGISNGAGEILAEDVTDLNYINTILFTPFRPPEHDLEVRLEAPTSLLPGRSTILNATVNNLGLNNETSVELQLLINGTIVDSVIIPELLTGSSYTLSHTWTPTVEGTYNITAYAPPVLNETVAVNNLATKMVYARVTILLTFNQTCAENGIFTLIDGVWTIVSGEGSFNQTVYGDLTGIGYGNYTYAPYTRNYTFTAAYLLDAEEIAAFGVGQVGNLTVTSLIWIAPGILKATWTTEVIASSSSWTANTYSKGVIYNRNIGYTVSNMVDMTWYASSSGSGTIERTVYYMSVVKSTDISPGTNTVTVADAEVTISTTQSGVFVVGQYKYNPGSPPPPTLKTLDKYFEIDTSVLDSYVMWPIEVKIYYTDEEVINAGVEESTLAMYEWDSDLGKWTRVPESGVDTVNNYVWARLYSLSPYSPMGSPKPAPKPVGGKATPINIPIDKPELQTPWIWLMTIILPLVAIIVFVSLRKRNNKPFLRLRNT